MRNRWHHSQTNHRRNFTVKERSNNLNTEQQFVQLLQQNKEKYYRLAFAYTKNQQDALDIVYGAIVRAMQKLHTIKKREFMDTWFYRILINESVSFLRRSQNIIYFDELPQLADQQPDTDQHIALYSAIDRLSPELKTIVILRFFEDRPLKEIAALTSTNLSTVKARLYRALKILKIEIGSQDDDW